MPEYFIICQNPHCERLKRVRRPSEQKQYRFCSRRCAGKMVPTLTHQGRVKGGNKSAATRRRQLLRRLVDMTKIECFRAGYDAGLKSKCTQIKKKYILVPR